VAGGHGTAHRQAPCARPAGAPAAGRGAWEGRLISSAAYRDLGIPNAFSAIRLRCTSLVPP